eukprot:NODE_1204_length_957_cov_22.206024_g1159_i0.p1 GENE.NODE_1204_length_957_cov_22.206024_g1159_i0~~NODE_1204_length_957_cov_22.206024_g1159_i0.p1  ORF type:complete len:271 (-),score=42.12 NODE_1204_length_957_cov_22.206024_g1159_i0:144-908(-)
MSSSRKPIIGGNWKCNGNTKSINELTTTFNASKFPSNVEVVVFPPAIYMQHSKNLINQNTIQVGAQNCWVKNGAFTGELSPEMIKDCGFDWVILGHSERRHVFHETEENLTAKLRACLDNQLKVVYCVGEQENDREGGKTKDIVFGQLKSIKNALKDEGEWDKLVIAYEPVWAIGTGKVATPEIAQETHSWIRGWIKENISENVSKNVRIQYGGSVKGKNSEDLAKQNDIDGFLVGGASLTPDFVTICNSFSKL